MPQQDGKPTRQNALTFYLNMLVYMFLALIVRAATFAPLLCLFLFPAGSPLRYLAVLCPMLLLFLVLPLRFSFAESLVQKPRKSFFSVGRAFNMGHYGEKLAESLTHALSVLKWGIPLVVMLGLGYYYYTSVDAFSLIGSISLLGESITTIYCDIVNFFIRLFGSASTLEIAGGLAQGLYSLVGVIGVGLLLLLLGMMRNSAYRYIWVHATREGHTPRTEARRRLRGHRFEQFGVALVCFALWLPFLLVVAPPLSTLFDDLPTALLTMISSTPDLSPLISSAWLLVFAFVFLYCPLLPVRRILTAWFASKKARYARPRLDGNPAISQVPSPLMSRPESEASENAPSPVRADADSSSFTSDP